MALVKPYVPAQGAGGQPPASGSCMHPPFTPTYTLKCGASSGFSSAGRLMRRLRPEAARCLRPVPTPLPLKPAREPSGRRPGGALAPSSPPAGGVPATVRWGVSTPQRSGRKPRQAFCLPGAGEQCGLMTSGYHSQQTTRGQASCGSRPSGVTAARALPSRPGYAAVPADA
jgi:hypothetical protein